MKKVKIVLKKDIEFLGKEGEVKDVKSGYFRNYLYPQDSAILATKAILEEKEKKIKSERKEKQKKIEKLQEIAAKIEKTEIVVKKRAKKDGSLYAKVRDKEIAEKIDGVNEKMIEIEKPIEKIGKYKIKIKIFPKIKPEMILKVEKKTK